MDEIGEQLAELRAMTTVSEASGLVHELLARRLMQEGRQDEPFGELFRAHVRRELRFHRALGTFLAAGDVSYGSVVSLADKRRVSLQEALDQLDEGAAGNSADCAPGMVLRAECQRGLGDLEASCGALRAAIAAGLSDPVVHYALGMDLSALAEESQAGGGAFGQEDPSGRAAWPYREALLAAVSAFEAGLSGGPLDSRLYQAMSECLERAGFTQAAEDARRQAGARAGDVVERPAPEATAPGQLALGEIEQSELARYLRGSFVAADILQGADGDPPR
jgi:hypothetical protein